ncbi:MAG TPA: hypothetical protein VMT52_10495 [Planctomycetota bacterium]|nr:hypothetical protein [Planctomycetota bacterium]
MMKRNGSIASALFTALSMAGIVALFSQTGVAPLTPAGGHKGSTTSLDPGWGVREDVSGIVPMALEKGVKIQLEGTAQPLDGSKQPIRLRLR